MKRKIIENVFLACFLSVVFLVYVSCYHDLQMSFETILSVFGGSLIMVFLLEGSPSVKELSQDDGREKAKRPRPQAMMFKEPLGFCFGRFRGKYVCKKVDEPGSILVVGSSGCGKSSTIIQSFLLNPNNQSCNSLVLDLKGELTEKCIPSSDIYSSENPDGRTIIVDPLNRVRGSGWNPFYSLTEKSTEVEVMNVMNSISLAIIPTGKGETQVWSMAAQQFLRAAMTYFFFVEKIQTLPDIIAAIKSKSLADVIEQVLTGTTQGGAIYTTMINFSGLADETRTSIDLNLSQRITIFFTNPDLNWCLGACPRKASPKDMLEHNIMLCLPIGEIEKWAQLVMLIFNQYFEWACSLPEKEQAPDRPFMTCILDETVALLAGIKTNLPGLSQMLRIGARGKGITILLCVQSISGLVSAIGDKEEVKDMISNCTYKYILDSCDTESSEEIIDWCGTYLKKKVTGDGKKISISYESDKIVKKEELMSLAKSGMAILVSSAYGYMLLEKVFVFKDKFYRKLLQKVKASKGRKE